MARSCAVWPLAGSYCCSGRKVGLPDRREPWRVPAPVGKSSNYISSLLLGRPQRHLTQVVRSHHLDRVRPLPWRRAPQSTDYCGARRDGRLGRGAASSLRTKSARFLHRRGCCGIFSTTVRRSIARRTTLVTNAGQPAAATPIGRSFWRAGTADAEVPAGKSALLDLQPFPRIPDAAPHGPGAPRVGASMRGHRATNNSVPIVTELERTSESDFGAPLPAPEGHIGRLDQHAQLLAIDVALFRHRTAASRQVIALAAEWLIFSAPGQRPLVASWTERRLRPVVASGPDDLRAMRLM